EGEIAGALALVLRSVRIVCRDRYVREIAGRIVVVGPADVREQIIVARAPVEAVGVVPGLGRTVVRSGHAAAGIVDEAPAGETLVALIGIEHAIPVDQHAETLLEDIGVKTRVSRRRVEP